MRVVVVVVMVVTVVVSAVAIRTSTAMAGDVSTDDAGVRLCRGVNHEVPRIPEDGGWRRDESCRRVPLSENQRSIVNQRYIDNAVG